MSDALPSTTLLPPFAGCTLDSRDNLLWRIAWLGGRPGSPATNRLGRRRRALAHCRRGAEFVLNCVEAVWRLPVAHPDGVVARRAGGAQRISARRDGPFQGRHVGRGEGRPPFRPQDRPRVPQEGAIRQDSRIPPGRRIPLRADHRPPSGIPPPNRAGEGGSHHFGAGGIRGKGASASMVLMP